MKISALMRMTFAEALYDQIFWLVVTLGALLISASFLVSEVALSAETRLYESASYFMIDILLLFYSVFQGAHVFRKDFHHRGLAEILIPMGVSGRALFFSRICAHILILICISLFLYQFRNVGMAISGIGAMDWSRLSVWIILFSTTKAILAFILAANFGIWVRPILAIVGVLTLFALGHFSVGLIDLQNLRSDQQLVGSGTLFLSYLGKLWNPSQLVLQVYQSQWELPDFKTGVLRLIWGLAWCAALACSAHLFLSRVQVREENF